MKHLLVVLLVACSSAPPKPTPVARPSTIGVTDADALAAYEAKAWPKCAQYYEVLAAEAKGLKHELAAYNAACCHALAGTHDRAFALLDQVIRDGMRDVEHLKNDPDLVSLHPDARWAKTVANIEQHVQAWEASLGDPALRKELLVLVDLDQKARFSLIAKPDDPERQQALAAIDKRTTARLKEVVAKRGWPGKRMVGEDGARAAWLMVQHADADVEFQRQCLALLEAALAAGDVEAQNYAYLWDRVAVADNRPQRWGTQFKDGVPQPIEDEANVDARRKAVGLGTMAEYKRQMEKMYGPPKK